MLRENDLHLVGAAAHGAAGVGRRGRARGRGRRREALVVPLDWMDEKVLVESRVPAALRQRRSYPAAVNTGCRAG
jgi:hypothetical protein